MLSDGQFKSMLGKRILLYIDAASLATCVRTAKGIIV